MRASARSWVSRFRVPALDATVGRFAYRSRSDDGKSLGCRLGVDVAGGSGESVITGHRRPEIPRVLAEVSAGQDSPPALRREIFDSLRALDATATVLPAYRSPMRLTCVEPVDDLSSEPVALPRRRVRGQSRQSR